MNQDLVKRTRDFNVDIKIYQKKSFFGKNTWGDIEKYEDQQVVMVRFLSRNNHF